MWNTNRRRLLGIVLTAAALFFLSIFLFLNGMVVRDKGFPAPLIDTTHCGEAAACAVVALLGVWLTISGKRRSC